MNETSAGNEVINFTDVIITYNKANENMVASA